MGKQNGSAKTHLLLKKLPEREGSFLGVLLRDEVQVSLYLIEAGNRTKTEYTMTPLEVTANGDIGSTDENPSLVISTTENKDKETVFRILSANTTNKKGFEGFLDFDGKESSIKWINTMEKSLISNLKQIV